MKEYQIYLQPLLLGLCASNFGASAESAVVSRESRTQGGEWFCERNGHADEHAVILRENPAINKAWSTPIGTGYLGVSLFDDTAITR